MANALIPVTTGRIGTRATLTCNARELHTFLEVGRDCSNWIKDRIADYGFVEGEDFAVVQTLRSPNSASAKARAQTAIDYHLSLDMAKELGMVERTEQGRNIRRYFIACETQAQAKPVAPRIQPTRHALRALPPPVPTWRMSAELQAAIDMRCGQIVGSAYSEIRQWLVDQVVRGCTNPDGSPAANFTNTVAGADFTAFATNYASRHLETIGKLLHFIQQESGDLITRVNEEKARLKGQL